MLFDRNLAQSIVDRSMQIIDCNINIMDCAGVIIASGDLRRLGEIHQGAVLALSKHGTVEIDDAMVPKLNGVKPGVNLPLRVEDEVVGCIGLTGEPAKVLGYAELVRLAAETMLEQARLTQLLARDARMREELVLGLIKGESPSPSILGWSKILGLDLSIPRVAAVVEVDSGKLDRESLLVELQRLHTMLMAPSRDDLIATISLNELVVLKPALNSKGIWDVAHHRRRIEALLARMTKQSPLGLRIALGQYFPDTVDVALSYEVAATTLKIGKRINPDQSAFFYEDLCWPVLLESMSHGWQYREVRQPLDRLLQADKQKQLVKTLRVWFDQGMCRVKTADALNVHRNTLDYRMRKISDICRIDLTKSSECFRMYLALEMMGDIG
jgi:carbohydrate diacid regulator